MKLLYEDKKHKFKIWRHKRVAYFVAKDTAKSAHLDNELSMAHFKKYINNWINERNIKDAD